MAIENVVGDLFDPKWNFDAIGHGVNCQGLMGSGIAVPFRTAYPEMYYEYKVLCGNGWLLPGQVFVYGTDNDYPSCIFNIASQFRTGPDAKLPYLKAAMHYVRFYSEHRNFGRVGLPRIGAGIGGLVWEDAYETIREVVEDSKVMFTIVSLE